MVSPEVLKKLMSENEFLQLQLQDVNEMIAIREEELGILREKAKKAIEMKSQLESVYEEISYMQNLIGKQQQKAEGAASRELSMEDEMLESMRLEKEYYNIRDQYQSSTTALNDIKLQLGEASLLYKQLHDAHKKIGELESKLDISSEENELLQYEIIKLKKKMESQKDNI